MSLRIRDNIKDRVRYRWQDLPWKKIEKKVFKLQKRIYQASCRGNVKLVHRLQRLLSKSFYAKCLAVRRVTQDNQGKKTSGIDGVRCLTPKQRLQMVGELRLTHRALPVRRTWIKKPGKDEKRPLGIPIMLDRATQALVKLMLEPEWEAKFEATSYGFRPGRCCHDAIEAIFKNIRLRPKYVLDADIEKCFDRIDHEALTKKMNTTPCITRQIKAWLKAGAIDKKRFLPTEEGTPQGGVISPLLANIALHGMEEAIQKVSKEAKIIRYADDLVILHADRETILNIKESLTKWLRGIGLNFKGTKTRVTHTREIIEQKQPGFDFLGFTIHQYKVGKRRSGKSTDGKMIGFKTIIKTSKEKIKTHWQRIRETVKKYKNAKQEELIEKLNPVIRGWCNYQSTQCNRKLFEKLDVRMYKRLKSWAKRRHSNKSWEWIKRRYWKKVRNDNWVFGTEKKSLIKYGDTKIRRHIMVKGNRSPFDGDFTYWATRLGKYPGIGETLAKLLKAQNGRCNYCGLYFMDGDLMEKDHITSKEKGGKSSHENRQLLHRHCHDKKTSEDRSRCTDDNS
jgi:RNA-directed DNA polymerase